jgi:hypothetical protein
LKIFAAVIDGVITFRPLYLMSGHGGNTSFLVNIEICRRASLQIFATPVYLGQDGGGTGKYRISIGGMGPRMRAGDILSAASPT